jgi:hypothetical protein
MARALIEVAMVMYLVALAPLRSAVGLRRVTTAVAVFYAASITLFICTLYLPAARELRASLYLTGHTRTAALEADAFEDEDQNVQQGGFAFLLHMFGYQLAAGVPLLAGFAVGPTRGGVLAAIATVAGVTTLFLAGQRSALLGFALVSPLILILSHNRRGILAFLGATALAATPIMLLDLPEIRKYNTVDRLQSSADTRERLALQVWAVDQVARYPMGIVGAGVDYASIASVWTPRGPLAPHNGYITRMLWYGWPVGVCTFGLLGIFVLAAARSLRLRPMAHHTLELSWLFASVSVMANALFHNASVVTGNSDTIIAMLTYLSVADVRRARSSSAKPARRTRPLDEKWEVA